MKRADFLVEIGTEELPPKALKALMEAFADNLREAVDAARLERGEVHGYASPRRLAVLIESLGAVQAEKSLSQKGPPVDIAFDARGKPLPPAIAFAKKCGVSVDELGRSRTKKGEWLACTVVEKGLPLTEVIAGLVEHALVSLPIPRRMRWGEGDAEFVRPVHWIVLLYGQQAIEADVMGIRAGNETRGHRFHSDGPIRITEPGKYLELLEREGHVIADFERRRELVASGVADAAREAGGAVVDGETLYDEVTALVEWPVPVLGDFDARFLKLPREVVISTLTSHQRYFPLADGRGELLPRFVTVANLESREPAQVREGNERVIRPRLADAAFYWDQDRRQSLASRRDALKQIVYQRGLGSLYDRSERLAALANSMASKLGIAAAALGRAAALSKCDLVTGMVGEFPELQGIMGGHYAAHDGESAAVARAIGEHYRPRFAGDKLPGSAEGRLLAVADRLDTLAGAFAIGKKPSGNRDPFGLRRAALGVIRLLVECELDVDLDAAIVTALGAQPPLSGDAKNRPDPRALAYELYAFIMDRARGYFLDRDPALATETFDAVLERRPASLVDFDNRLAAVQSFLGLEEASSLAAANKRIANILRKASMDGPGDIDEKRLDSKAEKALFAAMRDAADTLGPLLAERRYTEALSALAALRSPVDRFFDEVLVMADEAAVRNNRLALLSELRRLFSDVADISRLAIA